MYSTRPHPNRYADPELWGRGGIFELTDSVLETCFGGNPGWLISSNDGEPVPFPPYLYTFLLCTA